MWTDRLLDAAAVLPCIRSVRVLGIERIHARGLGRQLEVVGYVGRVHRGITKSLAETRAQGELRISWIPQRGPVVHQLGVLISWPLVVEQSASHADHGIARAKDVPRDTDAGCDVVFVVLCNTG